MKTDFAYPLVAVREAAATVLGWALAVLSTSLAAFVIAYWIGHREITDMRTTVEAIAWLPMVWAWRPNVLIPLTSAALTWYLPIYFESRRFSLLALAGNFILWIVILAPEIERCANGKFWHW